MKKLISLLLAMGIVLSVMAITAFAEEPAKEFIIDGVLDPWYLTTETTPMDDLNTYHTEFFDGFVKTGPGNGSAPYEDLETKAAVYTAYDDDYVYFYIKVWDDELVYWKDLKPEDYNLGNSSCGDSIEIWFDPDPKSVEKVPAVNPNSHYFCTSTRDENQGDVQMRFQAAVDPDGNFFVDDFHKRKGIDEVTGEDIPLYKPGYEMDGQPVCFDEWIYSPDNVCPFYFENEPVIVNEWTKQEVSSGYGVEVRLPRNNDEANSYRFNIAVNNSSPIEAERYALALGGAWWLSYAGSLTVDYSDVNPFFAQEIDFENTPPSTDNPGTDNPGTNTDVPTIKLGDINGDEAIDAKDALLVLRIAVEKYTPSDDEKVAADVNEDKSVDAKDALEILKYAVQKPSVLG